MDVVERDMDTVPLAVPPPPPPPTPPPMLLRVATSPVPDIVLLPIALKEGVIVEVREMLGDELSLGLGEEEGEAEKETDPDIDTEGVGVALRHSVAEVQGEADTEEVLH